MSALGLATAKKKRSNDLDDLKARPKRCVRPFAGCALMGNAAVQLPQTRHSRPMHRDGWCAPVLQILVNVGDRTPVTAIGQC